MLAIAPNNGIVTLTFDLSCNWNILCIWTWFTGNGGANIIKRRGSNEHTNNLK